ncbi:MAG: calcium-binding protein, partial [Bosea sp. (in: a-proteobacteria)]
PGVYTPNPWIVGTINGEAIVGTGANEIIGGGLGNDSIAGGFGNDTIDGGGGSDVMAGGLGDDTYITDSLGDFIGEGVNEGNDIVLSGVSYAMGANIEQVVLTGFAADGVLGNDLANAILGNNYDNGISGGQGGDVILGQYGNDIINGGEGADYMDGFIGTDTFFVDNAGDVVVEIFEGGVFDTVWTTVHFTLPDYVEIFIAQGNGNINGVGNNDVTLMLGNSGVNALAGLGGGDIILGQGGADVIDGGSGNDTISGGTESDTLIGGLGNDLFVYSTFNEGGATGDVYTDFTTGFGANGDILDLRPLFTTFAPGFGTTSASAIIAGYLTFTQGGADTYVFVDPNGGVHNPGEQVFLALLQNVNANALQANTLVV